MQYFETCSCNMTKCGKTSRGFVMCTSNCNILIIIPAGPHLPLRLISDMVLFNHLVWRTGGLLSNGGTLWHRLRKIQKHLNGIHWTGWKALNLTRALTLPLLLFLVWLSFLLLKVSHRFEREKKTKKNITHHEELSGVIKQGCHKNLLRQVEWEWKEQMIKVTICYVSLEVGDIFWKIWPWKQNQEEGIMETRRAGVKDSNASELKNTFTL